MTPAFAPPCPFLSQLSSSSDLPADGANSGTHSPDWGAGHQRRAVTMASAGGGVHSERRRGSHVLGVALLSLAWLVLARPGAFTSCAAAPNGVTGRRDSDLIRVVLGEDPSRPSFEIVVRGKTWLASSQPYLRHEGTTRTPENGTLELVGTGAISGADAKLGPYDGVSWEWATTSRDGTRVTMKTAVKWFPHGVVLFEQTFPDGARWTQTPGLDCGPGRPEMATCPACASMTWPGLASAFPTFSRDPAVAQEDLGFLEFYGIFENGESGAWGESKYSFLCSSPDRATALFWMSLTPSPLNPRHSPPPPHAHGNARPTARGVAQR